MKKINKIIGGLAVAAMLGGFLGTESINAETLGSEGSSSKDVVIDSVNETETFNVTINWSKLVYMYNKVTEDSYAWSAFGGTNEGGSIYNNWIEITNDGINPINTEFSFNSSINGVTPNFTMKTEYLGDGTCTKATSTSNNFTVYSDGKAETLWGESFTQTHTQNSDSRYLLYSDDTCTTLVPSGTSYDANASYYYVAHKTYSATTSNGNTVEVAGRFLPSERTIASEYLKTKSYLTSTARVTMELEGGSLEDVKAALSTTDKKIGTLTVTISSSQN